MASPQEIAIIPVISDIKIAVIVMIVNILSTDPFIEFFLGCHSVLFFLFIFVLIFFFLFIVVFLIWPWDLLIHCIIIKSLKLIWADISILIFVINANKNCEVMVLAFAH